MKVTTNTKERALEIFKEHLHLIPTEGQTVFRKTVMTQIMAEFLTNLSSAATHYNNAKKTAENQNLITGVGRNNASKKNTDSSSENCYTVCEVIVNEATNTQVVNRTRSYFTEEEARAVRKQRMSRPSESVWKLIKGLGPNVGDTYKLDETEIELA